MDRAAATHRRPARILTRVIVAAVVILVATVAMRFLLRTAGEQLDGWFEAADYPGLFVGGGWGRYGLPSTLPANASEVFIYAPASAPSMLPSPDQYVEVRFVLPHQEATALLAAATAAATTAPNVSCSYTLSRLHTSDDRDPTTPVPLGVQHAILKNPSGSNVGGVSVNASTGEVVYWIFEN